MNLFTVVLDGLILAVAADFPVQLVGSGNIGQLVKRLAQRGIRGTIRLLIDVNAYFLIVIGVAETYCVSFFRAFRPSSDSGSFAQVTGFIVRALVNFSSESLRAA